jgi:tetraacyldisaccharide 4'-kinase
VGPERPAAAQILVDAGCDVIVSDDGLQHYALRRDCEIVVIDAERGFGNGHLLPAGPLREDRSRLAKVDAIIVNGASAGTARFDPTGGQAVRGGEPRRAGPSRVFGMHLQASQAVSLLDSNPRLDSKPRDLREFSGQSVHAVAGIGNPQRFFTMLRAFGMQVIPHELPDHAVLGPADIEFGDGRPVLMTEKDAVKCAAFAKVQHWYVPVSAGFGAGEGAQLLGIVTRLIGEHGGAAQGNHG